jgi:hypothetical protein
MSGPTAAIVETVALWRRGGDETMALSEALGVWWSGRADASSRRDDRTVARPIDDFAAI